MSNKLTDKVGKAEKCPECGADYPGTGHVCKPAPETAKACEIQAGDGADYLERICQFYKPPDGIIIGDPLVNAKKDIMKLCGIIDRQAEQIKAKDTYIGELLAKWNQALEQIKATDKMLAEYERLNETVSISCNPPDDCNDPVVLKKYMKACYEAVVPED